MSTDDTDSRSLNDRKEVTPAGYFAEGPQFASLQFFLNGRRIGSGWSGFSATFRRSNLVVLGEGDFVIGVNEIIIEIDGADKRTKAFSVGIDGFEFARL